MHVQTMPTAAHHFADIAGEAPVLYRDAAVLQCVADRLRSLAGDVGTAAGAGEGETLLGCSALLERVAADILTARGNADMASAVL